MSIDLALFILRLMVGLILLGHAAYKFFGWFGGFGWSGTLRWFESMGLIPGGLWAAIAALGEFGGGLCLLCGFLNPLGSLAIIGALLMGIFTVHWSKGFWSMNEGLEYPLVLLILTGVLGLLGPARYSLDALFGIALPTGLIFWSGLVIVVLVIALGLGMSQQRRKTHQQIGD